MSTTSSSTRGAIARPAHGRSRGRETGRTRIKMRRRTPARSGRRARAPRSTPDRRLRARHAGVLKPLQLLAEVLDLVPQPRRVLEPEVARRLVHLLLKRLDQAGQLLARHLSPRRPAAAL